MNRMLRITAAALSLITLLLLAASCGNAGAGDTTTAAVTAAPDAGDTAREGYDKNGYILDTLGELDFKEAVIQTVYWSDVENQEYFAEQMDGSEVNDAIFTRNLAVEDRLNIKLEYVPTLGNSGKADAFNSFIQNAIAAGDRYDIISAHSRSIGLCAYNGLTQDLLDLSYLNFDMPWWQDSLLTTATINDQLHFVSGDISTNMLYMMYVMFYNKELLKTYELEDPYELVKAGTWTYDKLIEMSTGVYLDLDKDNTKSDGDQFGQAAYTLHIDSYLWGSGIVGIDRNEAGDLILSDDFKGEKCVALIDKLYNYLTLSQDTILYSSGAKYKTAFAEGRNLFITDRADIAIYDLSDKTFELGILPVPKYNAEQQDYFTLLGNPFSLYAIPVNAADADMAAAVLECMASESYRTVTPIIFEITMKFKYSSTNHDSEIYDIVRDGAVYDLSRIFWKVFSSGSAPDSMFEAALSKGSTTWTSQMKAFSRSIDKTLKNIQDAFTK